LVVGVLGLGRWGCLLLLPTARDRAARSCVVRGGGGGGWWVAACGSALQPQHATTAEGKAASAQCAGQQLLAPHRLSAFWVRVCVCVCVCVCVWYCVRPWLHAAFVGLLLCFFCGVLLCPVLCCVWVGGSGSGEEGPSGRSERSELFTTALWAPGPVHNMLPAQRAAVGFVEPGLQAGLVEVVLTSDLQGITSWASQWG
jgi:hypothetical protein